VALNDAFLAKPTLLDAVTACIGAAALFTIWLLTTLACNRDPREDAVRRLLILGQMAALVWVVVAVMATTALASPIGLTAYAIALLTVAGLWWRAGGQRRTSAALMIAGMIALAGVLLPSQAIWIVLLAANALAALPAIAEWSSSDGAHEPEHLSERMGLFILVVLGLSFGQLVVDLGDADGPTDFRFFILMFVLMFTVWWMYFGLKVPDHPVRHGDHRRAWITAHYLLLIGIAGAGDILSALTAFPDDESAYEGAGYLGVSLALILIAIAILIQRPRAISRIEAGVLVLIAVAIVVVSMWIDAGNLVELRVFTLVSTAVILLIAVGLAINVRRKVASSHTPTPSD
jgi:low temperature requirement protein LtrA